ncbi:MAG: hypothetical protein LBH59_09325 [Planctomycetaceae bacterium]|jgi:hypothetical protein|nr:hypothetical protein [Planctomycetaceae bacterium]
MKKILLLIFFVILFLVNTVNLNGKLAFSQVAPSVVMMGERSFMIPFQVLNDNNNIDRTDAVELLVSKDRGVSWYSVGRKSLDAKTFLFEADSDGEYWFSFRTITVSGTVKRSVGNSPQMRVFVDTSNTSNLNPTNKINNTIANENKSHLQKNYNNAGINTYKIAEGRIQPPKPTIFNKNSEKIANKKINKNKNNLVDNTPNSNEIEKEQLNLATTDQLDQGLSKSPIDELPFPISPDGSVVNINNVKNDNTDAGSDIGEVVELSGKLSKAERRVKLLLRLFNDCVALVKNEAIGDVIIKGVDESNRSEGIIAGGGGGDSDSLSGTSISSDIISMNNRNENYIGVGGVDGGDGVGIGSVGVIKTVEVPSAVEAVGSELVAGDYQLSRNDSGSKLRITGVTMNVATEQRQIIVKWSNGDLGSGKLADVLRGDSMDGVWQPIAVGIPNNGEYWWYISPEDRKPFYLKIQTRNSINVINEDITKSPITIQD